MTGGDVAAHASQVLVVGGVRKIERFRATGIVAHQTVKRRERVALRRENIGHGRPGGRIDKNLRGVRCQ